MDLTPPPYRSHRGLAIATIVLIGGIGPLSLLAGVLHMLLSSGSRSANLVAALFYALVLVGFGIGSGIVFLVWLAGAYRNLPALGSTKAEISPNLRATPSEAVWSFLIPIVNLFRARRVMRHVWLESQPAPPLLADGTLLVPKTPLIDWWYGLWIISSFAGAAARSSTGASVRSGALSFAAGILCCLMVWRIEERQAAQMRDLELRRPAPPVVDKLR